MTPTIETKRLRLFLENDRYAEQLESILFEMMNSEKSREKNNALWWGLNSFKQEIARRIECIRERGGLLHVGAEALQ
jgi:hypothetical protein